jgi:hypothetical protein
MRRCLFIAVAVALAVLSAPASSARTPTTLPAAAAAAPGASDPTVARPPSGATPPRAAVAASNQVIAGQNGNLTIIRPDGALLMYYHFGWQDGTNSWAGPFHRGTGWNSFKHVISFGINNSFDNLYLATTYGGLIYAYYWSNGENRWINPNGTLVGGPGWQDTTRLVAAGWSGNSAYFYRVAGNGDLYWYRFDGIPGRGGAFTVPGNKIGEGWNVFRFLTAGNGGVFFAVKYDGTLNVYGYDNWYDGSGPWNNGGLPVVIDSGWSGGACGFQAVLHGGVSTAGHVLYAVDSGGDLRWNRYLQLWTPSSGCGYVVGYDWM